jgi:subtilisin family serine protease
MAVRYAADRGADVINMSLGSDESDDYLRDSILYAIKKGSIVVAASGNDGCDCISYPANYEVVVAVGASDGSNGRYSFSNYGQYSGCDGAGRGFLYC